MEIFTSKYEITDISKKIRLTKFSRVRRLPERESYYDWIIEFSDNEGSSRNYSFKIMDEKILPQQVIDEIYSTRKGRNIGRLITQRNLSSQSKDVLKDRIYSQLPLELTIEKHGNKIHIRDPLDRYYGQINNDKKGDFYVWEIIRVMIVLILLIRAVINTVLK